MIRSFIQATLILLITSLLSAQIPGTLQGDLADYIDMTVSLDSSGDFATLQAAINAVPDHSSDRTVIFIKKGIYREKIRIPSSKTQLTLIGEEADSTVVVWDDYAGRLVDGVELNTFTTQTIEINPDDFRAMNITFENDARPGGAGDGQNVAVATYGKRQIFLHCRFISWQDTYYTGSDDRQYVKDCFIEGAVDYIFGHTTTIFDSCQIHTVRSKGYITAASTKENYQFGYVFFNCRLTAPHDISTVYLGRPWKTFAQTVFFKCVEYENIHPLGWMTWDGKENTCYYAEYQCTGPGSDISQRVDWSYQLSDQQASAFTQDYIFSSTSSPAFTLDWDPDVETDSLYAIVKEHTVMFLDSAHMDSRVKTLLVNGEPVPGWDPSVYTYSWELPVGTEVIPALEVNTVNSNASVDISYPESLPGFGYFLVLAKDQATTSIYTVYFSIGHSYTNASLDSITVLGKPIEGFSPEILEYDFVLPAGTSTYFAISAFPQVDDAVAGISKPGSLPGDVNILVTAPDGITQITYTLHISLATGLESELSQEYLFKMSQTTDNRFLLEVKMDQPIALNLNIYNLSGVIVEALEFVDLQPGMNRLFLQNNLPAGLYVIHAQIGDQVASGSWIKLHK